MKLTLMQQQYEDMIKTNYALEQENARLKELNREMVEAFIQCNHILATHDCGMAYEPMYEIVSEALAKAEGEGE